MHSSPTPRLPGTAPSDYERYLRTDALLDLQKKPGEMVHRDELLFQTVHQSAELWLKHVAWELDGAGEQIAGEAHQEAARLLEKGRDGMACVLACTRMLTHLSPSDYHAFRPQLGNGSGFDSPGFKRVLASAVSLDRILTAAMADRSISPVDVAAARNAHPEFHAIIERMLDIDQLLAEWRYTHLIIVQRLLGAGTLGLQGMPVEQLQRRLDKRLFPVLWASRALPAAGGNPVQDP